MKYTTLSHLVYYLPAPKQTKATVSFPYVKNLHVSQRISWGISAICTVKTSFIISSDRFILTLNILISNLQQIAILNFKGTIIF